MRKLLKKTQKAPTVKKKTSSSWRPRWQGDQGNSSMCTAFSFLHLFEHEPVNHPRTYGRFKGQPTPCVDPFTLYKEAQAIDPWPGDNYDGTSTLAMMKVAQDRGYISQYAWEYNDVDAIVDSLLTHGPVIVGTNWYEGMMCNPSYNRDAAKNALLIPDGNLIGGHAYLLDGVNLSKARKGREVQVFNSWGQNWGWGGRAFMSLESLEKLLHEDGGESVIVEEIP